MDLNRPQISVIMPVYLRNEFLVPALDSILNQSFQNFELIVVANNCSDELWADLKQYQSEKKDVRLKLFRTVIGQITFNLNYAVNESKSDLIARMDADDISYPDRLQIQYNFMKNNPNVDIVGSCVDIIDRYGTKLKYLSKPQSNRAIRSALPYTNPISHPTVIFKKATFIKHSGYVGGQYSEDYYLWLRMARDKSVTFENIQLPLLQYRFSDVQTRGLRKAYAEVAGLLWAEFLFQFKFKYLIGVIVSSLKILKSRN